MKPRTTTQKKHKNKTRNSPHVLPALLVAGSVCSFGAGTATALELGEIQVNSALGQPLRASIAYALNPTEQLHDFCIYLRPGPLSAGMPTVTRARVSIRDGMIVLTGGTPVKEPMLGLQVAIDCPYTPHLLREYTLLIDPAERAVADTIAAPAADIQVVDPQNRSAVVSRESAPARSAATAPTTPVSVRSRYRVQPGDTLSTIVARIEDRTLGMWPSVDAIFAANPHAFANNDVNRLMAGSWLDIPDLGGASTVADTSYVAPVASPVPAPAAAASDAGAPRTTTYGGFQAEVPAAATLSPQSAPSVTPATDIEPVLEEAPAQEAAPATETATDPVAALRPGDVIVGDGTPVIAPIGSDTIEAAEAPAQSTIPVDVMPTEAFESDSGTRGWSWLIWLGGSGVALILGLLLFGRTFRERFGSTPIGEAEIRPRRSTDDPSQNVSVADDIDFEFEDTINSRAITLDADLADGSGLQGDTDLDVAEDFGFSATGGGESPAYMSFPEEATVELKETNTDIIPPNHRVEEAAIVAKEISFPDDDSEAYDLSMIVDATKQPIGDYDATAKDLQAVTVEMSTMDDNEYTVDDAVDYNILEQDYEEELSATQALNAEIARAAIELAERMDADEQDSETSEMPTIEEEMVSVEAQLDDDVPTVETLAGRADELTAALPASADATVEMSPADGQTMEMPGVADPANTAELTANLPTKLDAQNDAVADGYDITIEMDDAGNTIESKKTKAS